MSVTLSPPLHHSAISKAVGRALRRPRTSSYLLAASLLGTTVFTQAAPLSVSLRNLNGNNGFVIHGVSTGGVTGERSGQSVSGAGDINGDGVDDIAIGAHQASSNGNTLSGSTYLVFGGSNLGNSGSLNLSTLDGTNGFVVHGIDNDDESGFVVSDAGDINADGMDDLIIGAHQADPNGDNEAGESYVVFGGSSIGAGGTLNLSALGGSDGFVINGVNIGDNSGYSVSAAGDINDDGVDDLVIGARYADQNGKIDNGASYVVFGGSGIGSSGLINLSTLDGSDGFVISGVDNNDHSGHSVSFAGDINGDGADDLLIGAPNALTNGSIWSGASYVVFGGSTTGSSGSLNLSSLDGSNGFLINGFATFDKFGTSVSIAGDVNDDGLGDLIIGAYLASPGGNSRAGESYVVLGDSNIGSGGTLNVSALNGSNGFTIKGIDAYDYSGRSVSQAGDFNGDGVDDLILGAYRGDFAANANEGESYIVFGNSGLGATGSIDLSTLNGSTGFAMNGLDLFDFSGYAVGDAGDVNNDGLDDLIIGAPQAWSDNNSSVGESYIVFGTTTPPPQPADDLSLVSSCLAGNGRVDLNIVNTQTANSVYRLELQGLSARQATVAFKDWGRMPITGRPAGTYSVVVKRDGQTIHTENLAIDCSATTPAVSTPEVTILNACRAGNGYVLFQMVNPTASTRPYVLQFDGVANRSTSAAPFGQAVRATTGRPDGTYNYLVRSGSTVIDTGQVRVDCD